MEKSSRRFFWWTVVIVALGLSLPRLLGQSDLPRGGGEEVALSSPTEGAVGELVFFTRRETGAEIRSLNLKSQGERLLYEGPILEVHPGGDGILLVSERGPGVAISLLRIEDRTHTPLLDLATRQAAVLPRLSPDGRRLGYISQSSPARLEVIDLNSKKPIYTALLEGEVSSLEFLTEGLIAATVGTAPSFSLNLIDLGTRQITRLPEVVGGTLSRVDRDSLLLATFDAAEKRSTVSRLDLPQKLQRLTNGPFDDQPLPLDDGRFIFHRLVSGDERQDELILSDHGRETRLGRGLVPLHYRAD